MTDDPRPWWSSDAEATTTEPVDPVEAHRAARRGSAPGAGDGATDWWDLPPLDDRPAGDPGDGPAAGEPTADDPTAHGPDICGVCPICHVVRSLGESRPQLVAHLTEAARHLAAAVRDVLEDPPRPRGARAADDRDDPDDRAGGDGFQRIDLD